MALLDRFWEIGLWRAPTAYSVSAGELGVIWRPIHSIKNLERSGDAKQRTLGLNLANGQYQTHPATAKKFDVRTIVGQNLSTLFFCHATIEICVDGFGFSCRQERKRSQRTNGTQVCAKPLQTTKQCILKHQHAEIWTFCPRIPKDPRSLFRKPVWLKQRNQTFNKIFHNSQNIAAHAWLSLGHVSVEKISFWHINVWNA